MMEYLLLLSMYMLINVLRQIVVDNWRKELQRYKIISIGFLHYKKKSILRNNRIVTLLCHEI